MKKYCSVAVAAIVVAAFIYFLPNSQSVYAASGDIELVSAPVSNIYTQNDGMIVLRDTSQAISNSCTDAPVATIYNSDTRSFVEQVNLTPSGCDGSSHNTSDAYSGTDVDTIIGSYDVLDKQCPTGWDEDFCISTFSASVQVSFTVVSAGPVISPNLVNATISTAYSRTIGVTGGEAPLTWSIASGSLPTGLSLNPRASIP